MQCSHCMSTNHSETRTLSSVLAKPSLHVSIAKKLHSLGERTPSRS